MSNDKDIIGIVKKLLVWYDRSDISASDEQVYVTQAAKHCRALCSYLLDQEERLRIAEKALEKFANNKPEEIGYNCAHIESQEALALIRRPQ